MQQFTFFEVNLDPLTAGQLNIGQSGTGIVEDDDGFLEPSTTDGGVQFSIGGTDFYTSAYPTYVQTGSAVEIYSATLVGSGAPVTFAYLTAENDGADDSVNRIVMLSGSITSGNTLRNISLIDGDSNVPWSQITGVICFTPGTMIATPAGPRCVECLRPGDPVITRDNGVQILRWTGAKALPRARLHRQPELAPIRIRRNAFGPGLPERDMWVSPQHRMLLRSPDAHLMFGAPDVLVPAKALLDNPRVTQEPLRGVTRYIHLLFDAHEILIANGIETESFHPGAMGLSSIDGPARTELLSIFPELARTTPRFGPTARPVLTLREARLLAREAA